MTHAHPPRFSNAVAWAFVMNLGRRGIGLVTLLVLAKLLTPADFGVVAMALVYIAFLDLFLEQGLGAAIVQRKDLRDEHLDAAFWLTLGASVLLAALSVAGAQAWAAFNRSALLADVIVALTVMLPLSALTVVQQASLQRTMDFRALALRSNAAAVLGGVAGIAMALGGMGVWALVGQQAVGSLAGVVALWAMGSWRPRLRFSRAHARELLGFSLHTLTGKVGIFANRRSEVLMTGLFLTPAAVGVYRLADSLMNTVLDLTTRPVAAASFPHLSRLQDDPGRLRRAVRQNVRTTTLLTVPLMAVMATLAEPGLRLLGEQWVPAAGALQLLCVVGAAQSVTLCAAPLLQAVGRPLSASAMVWSLAAVKTAALGVVLSQAGGWTLTAQATLVAGVQAAVFWLVYVPINFRAMIRTGHVGLRDLLGAALPGVGLAAGVGALGVGAVWAANQTALTPIVTVGAIGPMLVGVAAIGAAALDDGIRARAVNALDRVRGRRAARGHAARSMGPAGAETASKEY